MTATRISLLEPGSSFNVQTIAALSAGQAAGTATILAANAARRSLKIVPTVDCRLQLATGGDATTGIPLFANVPNEFSGGNCPTNALYVTGLATGAKLVIWEA